VQGQLAICQVQEAYLVVGHVENQVVRALEVEHIRFDPDYWLRKLLPNLQHTYLNLLMPLFLLQNAGRVRRNTLEVLAVSDLGVLVRARLLSTELAWAPASGEHLRALVCDEEAVPAVRLPPIFTEARLAQLLEYHGIGRDTKSTLPRARQYLEGPDPKFSSAFWYSRLDQHHMFVFSSTGSFQTQRGHQRCYTVVLLFPVDPLNRSINTSCSCKNGTSGRCGHIAAALLAMQRTLNAETVHPVRPFFQKVMQRLPFLTMGNKSGGAPTSRADPSLSAAPFLVE
jgi:SWIM zinc finger